jgi:hypothetical protein
MVRVSLVDPLPAGIGFRLKLQPMVASMPEQLRLTAEAKVVAPPAGVTEKAKPVAATPANTVAEVLPVLVSVKSGAVTSTIVEPVFGWL